MSLVWYHTRTHYTANKGFTILPVTLPNLRTVSALRDAPFGSVLFLATGLFSLQLWVSQPCPPPCLLLIKHAPGGRRERGGGCVRGFYMHVRDVMSPHVSVPICLPHVLNKLLQQGSSPALPPASLQHIIHFYDMIFPLPFTCIVPVGVLAVRFVWTLKLSSLGHNTSAFLLHVHEIQNLVCYQASGWRATIWMWCSLASLHDPVHWTGPLPQTVSHETVVCYIKQ